MRNERITSRRSFLSNCLAGVAGIAAGEHSLPLDAGEAASSATQARVAIAHDALLRDSGGAVDSRRILHLLDQAVKSFFDVDEATRPWTRIVRPGQMVGVKVNTLGGRGISSNVRLVEAICERLQGAGVRPQQIVIWDRDSAELERAGFRVRTGGNQAQCFGTDRMGYEDDLVSCGSVGSRLSKILTQRCDVLINVPVLKDHDGAGVTAALKNMYGVIHNPNKYHPNGCNPYIADLNMLPEIRTKLRLTICDATNACFEGGPSFKPEFTWQHNALIVAQDSVALDTIGWRIIERKRAEKGLKTLDAEGRAPHYIATAADAAHRLGTNDPRRITLAEVRVA
ncbi:MAG: DUF362 domain-containing protein [Acidobacteriota bacterium]|nr:DUF362 domain-containing protein [Acidobacteriota bacterium]